MDSSLQCIALGSHAQSESSFLPLWEECLKVNKELKETLHRDLAASNQVPIPRHKDRSLYTNDVVKPEFPTMGNESCRGDVRSELTFYRVKPTCSQSYSA